MDDQPTEMLPDAALDRLFRTARTHNWFHGPVTDDQLRAIYELMKWGPTSSNCQPARILFLRSPEAKERLKPALSSANRDKTLAAPVTAILAYDLHFTSTCRACFRTINRRAAGSKASPTRRSMRCGT